MTDRSNSDRKTTSALVRFVRLPEVLDRVGVTWVTILRWEQQGLFPKRIKLGKSVVGWLENEIDDWCAAKIAARQIDECPTDEAANTDCGRAA